MLFLDIMLPDSTGIEIGHFLRKGRKNLNLQIVFISSNPSYALELFKIRPMDFLIKPFSSKDVTDILDEYSRFHLSQRNYFVYKSKQVTGKILYNDIIYFSSNIRKIDIFLKNGQIITIYGKLSDIEPRLSNAVFWRIHQSFIVNKYFIANCRYDCLELVNDIMLPISKNFRKDIREKILNE